MMQGFGPRDVPYVFHKLDSIALPKAKTTLYGIETTRLIQKTYGRHC